MTCKSTRPHLPSLSVQATPPQVFGYDDIGDCVKDELDVVGVGGAGHVGVHLLVGGLVLAVVLSLDVFDSVLVRVGTCRAGTQTQACDTQQQSGCVFYRICRFCVHMCEVSCKAFELLIQKRFTFDDNNTSD